MTFTALFEIGGLLHSFSMAQIGRKTDIWSMIAAGERTCRKTLSPRNWPILLFVMVLFPLTGVLSLSNAAYKVKIPLFIEIAIEDTPLTATVFKIFYGIMILAEIGVLFSINIYVLRENSFLRSCIEGWRLGKRRFGLDESVPEMTYDEIMQHEVINTGDDYKHVHITTLEEVLLLAKKNNVLVQVEPKPLEKNSGLEEVCML